MAFHYKSAHIFCRILLLSFILAGCGDNQLPINHLEQSLKDMPSYFITLKDMKEDGNFFTSYYHNYRVVLENTAWDTGWHEIPKNYYRANESFLGMVLASKKGQEFIKTASPPGYMYVGDSRYGNWRADNTGREYWNFNRGNALFNELEIEFKPKIYRNGYKAYKHSKSSRVPFFGLKKEYGTAGIVTKKTKPNFFERRMAKEKIKKTSFSQKVSQRVGRTRTSFRGRAGGTGK